MKVTIETNRGDRFKLEFENHFVEIQRKIEQHKKLKVASLDTTRFNARQGMIIDVNFEVEIDVKVFNRRFSLKLDESCNTLQLKRMIRQRSPFWKNGQFVLVIGGNIMTMVMGQRTLADYHAVDRSVLKVVRRISPPAPYRTFKVLIHKFSCPYLHIDNITETCTVRDLKITETCTVRELKMKITMHEAVRIPEDELILSFEEITNLADNRMLVDYGVTDGSTLMFRQKPLNWKELIPCIAVKEEVILVLVKNGSRKTMSVDRMEHVRNLRQLLQQEKESDCFLDLPGLYFFVHKRKVMLEDRTLLWHGVQKGHKIKVISGDVSNEWLGIASRSKCMPTCKSIRSLLQNGNRMAWYC